MMPIRLRPLPRPQLRPVLPGLAVALLVALAARFLSDHYGAPAMLMALLLGLALPFLTEESARTRPGIEFTARHVLRLGVALLGARISVGMLADLGGPMIALIVAGVVATMLFALLLGRLAGQTPALALLTGGAVAICGAAAAMAIAAVLPRGPKAEQNLAVTIVSVTVLSTLAMVLYPPLSGVLGFGGPDAALESAVFLGGTIHDVAQVVGAGFSVSPEVGEQATLVKLIRVSMLAPVVLVLSLLLRAGGEGPRPPLLPGFVMGFLLLAALNSAGLIPETAGQIARDISRWALLAAIAAVGMNSSLSRIMRMGGASFALMAGQSAFLAGFILLGMRLLG